MHFFGLSLVTFITAALASNTCKIVGGKGDGLCRKCPYKSCDIVKRFDYGKSYKFDCQKWGGYVEDGRGHRDK